MWPIKISFHNPLLPSLLSIYSQVSPEACLIEMTTNCEYRVWRGGGGNRDPAFPLFFHDNPASRTFVISIPNTVLFLSAKVLANTACWVAFKSRMLSRNFAFFPNPLRSIPGSWEDTSRRNRKLWRFRVSWAALMSSPLLNIFSGSFVFEELWFIVENHKEGNFNNYLNCTSCLFKPW